jgi:ATP-dependent RNA helicase DDX52/ROK1
MLDAEFLPQVQEIVAACTFSDVQKAVFSATLPAGVEKLAMSLLKDPIRIVVGTKYQISLSLVAYITDIP